MNILRTHRNMLVRVLAMAGLAGALTAFAGPEQANADCPNNGWSGWKSTSVVANCSCEGFFGTSGYLPAQKKLTVTKSTTSSQVEATALSHPTYNMIRAEGSTQTVSTILPVSQTLHWCQVIVH